MTETELRDAYLDLFSKRWDAPSLVDDLRPLREHADNAGLAGWVLLIDARIARTEKRFDDALGLLAEALHQEPENYHALFLKAAVFSELPEHRLEALQISDRIIAQLDERDDVASQQVLALAMGSKGVTLGRMDRPEEALAACQVVIDRFGQSSETALLDNVAGAMVSSGVALGRMDRPEEELAAYEAVIDRFGESSETALLENVAGAMFNRGVVLDRTDGPEKALVAYEAVIDRFGESSETALLEDVAGALFNRGVALGRMNRLEEALVAYEAVVDRFGQSSEMALLERVARAMVNKGWTLGQLDRPQDELSAYEAVVDHFGQSNETALLEQVATAMFNRGRTLARMDRPEEELAAYEALIHRFGESTEVAILQKVGSAMVNRAITLAQMDRPEEALAAHGAVIDRFGQSSETALLERAARAMVSKGGTLSRMDRLEEALATYEAVVNRFGELQDPGLLEEVARAMVGRGWTLRAMDRPEEALAAYEAMIDRFEEDDASQIGHGVRIARTEKAALATRLDRPDAAKAKQAALEASRGEYSEELEVYLKYVFARFPEETIGEYFSKMDAWRRGEREFLTGKSRFREDASCLLVLREWNSYTPALPAEGESDRGSGYYVRHAGTGIVIDPGYDFIETFHRAGGRLADVDHIVLTHAHDDHTAQFEALMMLLHQYNEQLLSGEPPKRVSLYLSQGCQRKFAGLVPTRDDPRIGRVVTLCRPDAGCSQEVQLTDDVRLTVLPAYHDDVVTRDTAVGLGFEFTLADDEPRRIVFTSDTGYYPRRFRPDGTPLYYNHKKGLPKLDTSKGQGLFDRYPKKFRCPDLLIAHIGSIRKEEFQRPDELRLDEREEGEWYYANHLGLLGTLTLLDKMSPPTAIISEFGAELRGFHDRLVETLAQALHDRQVDNKAPVETRVFTGDVTTVYYIAENKFLCHEDCQPHSAEDLTCRRTRVWETKAEPDQTVPDVTRGQDTRAHLCASDPGDPPDEAGIQDYYKNRFLRKLPHFEDC